MLLFVLLLGAIPLWGYAVVVGKDGSWLGAMGLSVAIGAAAGLMGFLFAFPNAVVQPEAPPAAGPPNGRLRSYKPSTHLDTITDWLTKTLVGVSMITFQSHIWPMLVSAAQLIADSLGNRETMAHLAVAWGYLVFFLTVGFLFGFLPARLYLGATLALLDNLLDVREDERNKTLNIVAQATQDPAELKRITEALSKAPPADSDVWSSDPNKGQFGGKAAAHGWELAATIQQEYGPDSAACQVTLIVRRTDGTPPAGTAQIHLHPTFPETPIGLVLSAPQAEHTITTVGVFTVGAVMPDGTRLELDLAKVPGGTPAFYRN